MVLIRPRRLAHLTDVLQSARPWMLPCTLMVMPPVARPARQPRLLVFDRAGPGAKRLEVGSDTIIIVLIS